MMSARFSRFAPATPDLLEARALLRRVDTKFVVPVAALDALVDPIVGAYAALQVPTGVLALYQSTYFDTDDLRCFHDHRRGRRPRHKVRIRHYPDRGVSFLEVKTKRSEEVTIKRRLAVPFGDERLGEREHGFLLEVLGPWAEALRPQLVVRFRRLSLIGVAHQERVTIDLELSSDGAPEVERRLGALAVVEVKQSPYSVRTPVMRSLQAIGARERSLSKYATSLALARPDLRQNRLRPELRALERMHRRG